MNKPIYIGYFTDAYASEAQECIKTLDAFGLEHEFARVEDRGDWCRNCAQKPEVIQRMMQKHDGRPLVYLDADARVRQYPHLFDTLDCDFAAHWRHGVELLSGTMFFGTTLAARGIVSSWCCGQRIEPRVWDQVVLAAVLDASCHPKDWRIERLPSTYTRVFDDPKMGEPVIEHMQASRRIKVA